MSWWWALFWSHIIIVIISLYMFVEALRNDTDKVNRSSFSQILSQIYRLYQRILGKKLCFQQFAVCSPLKIGQFYILLKWFVDFRNEPHSLNVSTRLTVINSTRYASYWSVSELSPILKFTFPQDSPYDVYSFWLYAKYNRGSPFIFTPQTCWKLNTVNCFILA